MHTNPSECPVCSSAQSSLVSERDRGGQPLRTVFCGACGHVFNDPIPSAEELARFYRDRYRVSYKGRARPRGRQIARNFARVEQFWREHAAMLDGRRRVLDVGAGSGEFLFFAKSLGLEARGIEPNKDYAASCRDDLGLDVETDSLESLAQDSREYDFIRLNHVIEHLRDPVDALARIAAKLAPGGALYVEAPDILRYARDKSKGGMFHYGHISNFSPWTLRAAAGRAGLAEIGETAAFMGDRTAAFFERGRQWTAEEAVNPQNAHLVAAALKAHAERPGAPLAKVGRLLRKLSAHIRETRLALSLSEPSRIGRHYVERLGPAARPAPRQSTDERVTP